MKKRAIFWSVCLLAFPGFLGAFPGPVSGQAVKGNVVDTDTGEPVVGAFVSLVHSSGDRVSSDLTSPSGTYELRASPGRYRVTVERIGFRTWTSDPFELAAGETLSRSLRVDVRAVELVELEVSVSRQCRIDAAEARVWEEARKALAVTSWSERNRTLQLELRRYRRVLDERKRRVRRERAERWTETDHRAFHSLPIERLTEEGYVRPEPEEDGFRWNAPDAEALLSDTFAATQCFDLDTSRRNEGLIGLAFEPADRPDVPEIEGVLWLEAKSDALRSLTFDYVGVEDLPRNADAGGRVDFGQLPDGRWFVQRWWIDMPLVARGGGMRLTRDRHAGGRFVPGGERGVSGYDRSGGEVVTVTGPDGKRVRLADWGRVEGVIRDPVHEAPLANARVRLEGTGWTGATDAEGRFSLGPLPAGTYGIEVLHPVVHLLWLATEGEVKVRRGKTARAPVELSGLAEGLARICPEMGEADHSYRIYRDRRAALVGVVRDRESGRSVPRANVETEVWVYFPYESPGRRGVRAKLWSYSAETDASGAYRICDLPGSWYVGTRVVMDGAKTDTTVWQMPSYGLVRLDLEVDGSAVEPEAGEMEADGLPAQRPELARHDHPLPADLAFWMREKEGERIAGAGRPADAGDLPDSARAVASLEEAVAGLCARLGDDGVPEESRSLVATLLDARTGRPLEESFVALRREGTAREADGGPIRTAVSDEEGRIFLCHVPAGEPLRLTIRPGDGRDDGTGYESLIFQLEPGAELTRRELRVRPAPAPERVDRRADRDARRGGPEAGTGATTELIGRVRTTSEDRPLRGARIELVGTDRAVASGRGGLFRISELEPGVHRLVVEHVGYRSDTVEVALEEGTATMVRLSVETAPVELPELTATVERTIRDGRVRGFYRRMERGNGRFITGEEVERDGWIGAFRRTPNVTIRDCVTSNGIRIPGCHHLNIERGRALLGEGECSPDVYIDGARISSGVNFSTQPLDMLLSHSPGQVQGIEIHTAGTAPPEYGGTGAGCGVVLVWTTR